ncbi:hypothetical protein Tco_0566519 [Tanacetum coccineum]
MNRDTSLEQVRGNPTMPSSNKTTAYAKILKCGRTSLVRQTKSLGTSQQTIWPDDNKAKVVMKNKRKADQNVIPQQSTTSKLKGYAQKRIDGKRISYGPLKRRFMLLNQRVSLIPDHPEKGLPSDESFVWIKASYRAYQLADRFTKALPEDRVKYLCQKDWYEMFLDSSLDLEVVRLGINPMIQPEPEDLPKDNPKLEIAVLRLKRGDVDWGIIALAVLRSCLPVRDSSSDGKLSASACYECCLIAANRMRYDDEILPFNSWVPIGKSNFVLDLQKKQRNPSFLSLWNLQNTNFFRAFTASASVPAIYVQQEALEITPIDQAHQFVSPPSGDAIIDFVNEFGLSRGSSLCIQDGCEPPISALESYIVNDQPMSHRQDFWVW